MTGKPSISPFSPQRIARVLIVDDHPIVREGLSALLSSQPDLMVCGEAADIMEAMKQVNETAPDVAVVDIALVGENGLELVRRIRAIDRSIRILVVSMYDDELYAERALEAGAMGYLNKHAASRHIVAAIRRILGGQRYLSDEMEARLSMRRASDGPKGTQHGLWSLSDRELEVFRMIGEGATTAEISEKLFVSVKTIESHRQKIKLKLDLRTSAELSREAVRFVMESN